uniref:FAD dependent oxidoreductase domain-containing protein n=1 Tax=Aplanochytrium stocchinoi TaxID=215587 RepID=A0A7S3PF77_9STRA
MEPNISIGVLGALYCPSAGIVSPYEYCIALAENAIMNGVRLLLEHKVTAINKLSLTPGGEERFTLETKKGTSISAKRVINCAGLYADELAGFVHDRNFYIRARKGDYIVLDKEEGARINHVLFQAPTEKWGKGILVSPTARGNLLLGPSAIIQDSKEATDTDTHELAYVVWAARRTMPHLDTTKSLTSYAGLRSRSNVHDFIIEESRISPGFFNVAGIESPGLTASPAIALEVVNLLKTSGLLLEKKSSEEFNRLRKHPVNFSANKLESVKNSVDGKEKTIICKCENITEAEINRALNSGIEIRCTDSIKWRTRAGMGWCQGARCRPLVAEMIAAKLGNGVRMQDVPKNMPSKEAPVRESRNFLSKL